MKDQNKRIIIIAGPTGVGKSDLSVKLAKHLNTQIISCDSMQIYRYMDIGTGKISTAESGGVVHHMLSIIDPDELFTVEDYKNKALSIVEALNKDNMIPIFTGGTGLYIDSLIYELEFSVAPPNQKIRDYYTKLEERTHPGKLHSILSLVDPISANRIHPNQIKRIVRALEVFDYTGRPFSEFNDYKRNYVANLDFILIYLDRDRQELYKLIDSRVDKMLESGLIGEVKRLLDMGYTSELPSLQAIGYREIAMYLGGEMDLKEAIDLIKRNSRRYAKRQNTWFNREERKHIISLTERGEEEAIKQILTIIGDEFHYE